MSETKEQIQALLASATPEVRAIFQRVWKIEQEWKNLSAPPDRVADEITKAIKEVVS